MANHGSWLVVAKDGKSVIGYALATSDVEIERGQIDEVGVLPDRQRSGIGKRPVVELAAWLRQLDSSR